MARSNELRKLLQERLKTVCDSVYHKDADVGALYPHLVYTLRSIDLGDLARKDYVVDIDVWDKGDGAKKSVEDIADGIEDLLNAKNLPQEGILPTFFLLDRKDVQDEDKSIQHKTISIQVQLYETEAGE